MKSWSQETQYNNITQVKPTFDDEKKGFKLLRLYNLLDELSEEALDEVLEFVEEVNQFYVDRENAVIRLKGKKVLIQKANGTVFTFSDFSRSDLIIANN